MSEWNQPVYQKFSSDKYYLLSPVFILHIQNIAWPETKALPSIIFYEFPKPIGAILFILLEIDTTHCKKTLIK